MSCNAMKYVCTTDTNITYYSERLLSATFQLEFKCAIHISHTYVTHWPGGLTQFTSMLCNHQVLSPLGDKIFILRAGMVMTLHTVVLVRFTNILAKYIHAIMIAENIELKQYSNLNSHPFANRNLN